MSEIFGEEIAKKMLNKKDRVEVAEFDKTTEILLVNGKPFFIRRKELVFPLVIALYELSNEEDLRKWPRRVVVDEGAVPYILNGADVMAAGITDADENINEGDFVFVVEENYGRPPGDWDSPHGRQEDEGEAEGQGREEHPPRQG